MGIPKKYSVHLSHTDFRQILTLHIHAFLYIFIPIALKSVNHCILKETGKVRKKIRGNCRYFLRERDFFYTKRLLVVYNIYY